MKRLHTKYMAIFPPCLPKHRRLMITFPMPFFKKIWDVSFGVSLQKMKDKNVTPPPKKKPVKKQKNKKSKKDITKNQRILD